jgi:putative transposase
MQDTGLKQKKRKNKHKTTDSKHKLDTYENLIKSIVPSYPNHIWATDITYVRLLKGFCYVAMIIDVFTKKIVGWNIKLTMETVLVKEALEYALQNRQVPKYQPTNNPPQLGGFSIAI